MTARQTDKKICRETQRQQQQRQHNLQMWQKGAAYLRYKSVMCLCRAMIL